MIKGEFSIAQLEIATTLQTTLSAPTIRTTFKNDKQIGFSFVRVLIAQFLNSFGFNTKISNEQIDIMTVDFLEKFDYESIYDIVLFLKMARRGDFGAAMHSVDSNLIFGDWFPKYLDMKAEEREKQYEKQKKSSRNLELNIEDVRKAYAKQQNEVQVMHDKVVAYVDKITTGINREQLETLISEWNNDAVKKEYVCILKRLRLIIK